jgi:Asp-tRNA(Asn)/Glu-tRNA(Gln) amidotransferase C subunit
MRRVVTIENTQPELSSEPQHQMAEQPPMESPPMMANMLEQIANTLGQPDVSPETLKQMAEQMKQLAGLMKQMPDMMEGDRMQQPMPPDKPMMPMDPMMNMMPMMQAMREANPDPKMIGVMMQMRGEMMQAMGAILLKYGKMIAVESEQVKPEASVVQPVKP